MQRLVRLALSSSLFIFVGFLTSGASCAPTPGAATPTTIPYLIDIDYVYLERADVIKQAGAIFVGRVVSFSPARWNQDNGEYWASGLPYHEIVVRIDQELFDSMELDREVLITVFGGSPAGSIRSGDIVIADKPEHTLKLNDVAVFFIEPRRIAWRPNPGRQATMRPVNMFVGMPRYSYLVKTRDGQYESEDERETPTSLDEVVAQIGELKR